MAQLHSWYYSGSNMGDVITKTQTYPVFTVTCSAWSDAKTLKKDFKVIARTQFIYSFNKKEENALSDNTQNIFFSLFLSTVIAIYSPVTVTTQSFLSTLLLSIHCELPGLQHCMYLLPTTVFSKGQSHWREIKHSRGEFNSLSLIMEKKDPMNSC